MRPPAAGATIDFSVCAPARFSFQRTVLSHGWFDLPPFFWDARTATLHRVLTLGHGAPRLISIREAMPGRLQIRLHGAARVTGRPGVPGHDTGGLLQQVSRMLRLEENLQEFHELCREIEGFSWVADQAAGRLLRSPEPYEDLVKLICTTNCSWAMTRSMVGRLTLELGEPVVPVTAVGDAPGLRHSFPTPHAMAAAPASFYSRRMRAGYRAPALRALAQRVAAGDLRPHEWLDPARPAASIRSEIESIHGAGRYVTETMLRLLGRYDGLGLDSWVRRKFAAIHHRGRAVGDRRIERFLAPFGRWRGLALWCNVTRDWFDEGRSVVDRLRAQKF